MENKRIAIATITWARTTDEELLLAESLRKLAAARLPVFVTDAGSAQTFRDTLHSIPGVHLHPATVKGVMAQALQSLSLARESGAAFILYTEPDKTDFFVQHLSRFLDSDLSEQTGVVLASRSSSGFASFPPFQQFTETAINGCCTEATGLSLEYTYGPFLLNTSLVDHLLAVNTDLGWGWRTFAFVRAHRLGYAIQSFEGDFYCPADQRSDDAGERLYRMKQLKENIEGILAGAKPVQG